LDDAESRAARLAFGMLLVLFLAAAQLVSIFEGAPAGPIARPRAQSSQSTAQNSGDAAVPAFTLAHGDAARLHVERLAGIGVKIASNTQTEQAAPSYILTVLDEVRENAHADVRVEVAVQRPSGSFNTDFLGGINAVYHNITNILCRISSRYILYMHTRKHTHTHTHTHTHKHTHTHTHRSEARGTEHALVINAHFDSSIGSPGAADDLSQVGVALELARLLASGTWQMPCAVILLFNGAEEFNWLAAHGFITSAATLELRAGLGLTHVENSWSGTARALVNLEALGSGGRMLLTRV
jgi:hypothetical protein